MLKVEVKDGTVEVQEEFVFEQLDTEVIASSDAQSDNIVDNIIEIEHFCAWLLIILIIVLTFLVLTSQWVKFTYEEVNRLCDIVNKLLGEVRKNDDSK